jgi:hypothetical protein
VVVELGETFKVLPVPNIVPPQLLYHTHCVASFKFPEETTRVVELPRHIAWLFTTGWSGAVHASPIAKSLKDVMPETSNELAPGLTEVISDQAGALYLAALKLD